MTVAPVVSVCPLLSNPPIAQTGTSGDSDHPGAPCQEQPIKLTTKLTIKLTIKLTTKLTTKLATKLATKHSFSEGRLRQ